MSVPHSPAELQRLYEQRFGGMHQYRDQVWQTLTSFFAQWIQPNATVLDLGCGHCEFINNVRSKVRFGMDLNPDSVQHAALGVKILPQNCAEPWELPDDSLDVIFTSNFFEHLSTKRDLRNTLAQGGPLPQTWGLHHCPRAEYSVPTRRVLGLLRPPPSANRTVAGRSDDGDWLYD